MRYANMTRIRSDTSVEEKISQKTAWGGTSRSDREGFLASQNLSVRRAMHYGRRRRDGIFTGLLGLLAFSSVVISVAVARLSYLTCRHLQETTGLIDGQTITTCTIHRSLWRLTSSFWLTK